MEIKHCNTPGICFDTQTENRGCGCLCSDCRGETMSHCNLTIACRDVPCTCVCVGCATEDETYHCCKSDEGCEGYVHCVCECSRCVKVDDKWKLRREHYAVTGHPWYGKAGEDICMTCAAMLEHCRLCTPPCTCECGDCGKAKAQHCGEGQCTRLHSCRCTCVGCCRVFNREELVKMSKRGNKQKSHWELHGHAWNGVQGAKGWFCLTCEQDDFSTAVYARNGEDVVVMEVEG